MEQQNNAAKFAFFYMLSLVALITLAMACGTVVFQVINKNIVDPLNQYQGSFTPEALKFAISALVISAPIFFLTMRQIYKNLFSGALPKESGIRKWLTYFIIFVSSVVMLGWLIATINSFLDGELTMKFILKAMTAIGIAAAIFTFYFYDIRRAEVTGKKDQVVSYYLYGSLAVVAAVFVLSLFYVESPTETRNRKFDMALLDNFNQIDSAIVSFYNENKAMPENLAELRKDYNYITDQTLVDPGTAKPIEYKVTEEKAYELCADFRTSNKLDEYGLYYGYKDRWPHDSGYQCIRQVVTTYDKGVEAVPFR
ncbi:MAG: DUF5671 domain-containing protein [Planctomycetes bacterium]|jgi:hypothetical protein|nr:DUF5671 domain-containing protein [Planctomycetota bacterium]